MRTNILALWMAACVAAVAEPGELDRQFAPDLRAWVAPDHVTVAPNGRAWIGGGFDQGDGKSAGDLVVLGENGGVAGEPAPRYLGKPPGVGSGYAFVPFPLANGDFLLPGESGGWLRMSVTGQPIGKGFPDRKAEEAIVPQFEREGKLWVIRRFADGRRVLERRLDDRRVDGGFNLPAADVLGAVPGPNGSVWVLAGADDTFNFSGTPVARRVFQADAEGTALGESLAISVPRPMELVMGPAGAFRLVYGADRSSWNFWPAPTSKTMRIEWYSAAGGLVRGQNFFLPLFEPFAWAEAVDGSFVATDARSLRRYRADGVEDATFQSPGPVRSVKALAGGKWLVDGLRRLNADGSGDTSWTVPELTRAAEVRSLWPLPGGRVLAGGNFAMADGLVRNRLVVFGKDGRVDPGFMLDERIQEWKSVAVSGNAIYVVTTEPVAYGNGVRSNLVKLGLDGVLDENYEPQVPVNTWTAGVRFQTVDNVSAVTALAGGSILVETSALGGDVFVQNLARLRADGSRDFAVRAPLNFNGFGHVLALANGGFVGDGVIYRRNGSVERDLTREGIGLRPLCQWLGGVVFLETRDSSHGRLRLWLGKNWVSRFRPPTIANAGEGVVATPGEAGGLYVSATWIAGQPELRRLKLTGRVDQSFHAPRFARRERQKSGNWWKAEDGRKAPFDVAAHESAVSPTVLLWHPPTRRLWAGGGFNVADGKPRDGLARLRGGKWWNF
ncbi:MAG: hypothetical protein ABIT37_11630 [Luteolibacter sp.]